MSCSIRIIGEFRIGRSISISITAFVYHRIIRWNEHLHTGICFVTPTDRHDLKDIEMFEKRQQVYLNTRDCHPERWAGSTRNWDHIGEVALNKRNNASKKNTDGKGADNQAHAKQHN